MNGMARTLLLPVLLFSFALVPGIPAGPGPPSPAVSAFPAGEELVYEVSWWVVNLGTIRLRVVDTARDGNGPQTRARADIDSYPELPFASLHVMTETVMDSEWYSREFLGITEDNHAWRTIRYEYAAEKNRLQIERGTAPGRESREFSVEKVETLSIAPKYQDGLSILYFARANAGSGRQINAPTVIEGAEGRTIFDFRGERTSEEIDAVEYPVDVIRFRGKAEFSGIFGLTGDFEGWVSNDAAKIPIRANLEVLLGSVKVELISWRRDGWVPPRAPED